MHFPKGFLTGVLVLLAVQPAAGSDPLPSWNDSASKRAILDFVRRVTDATGPDFVPVAERIATFDNDGTLWCEKPIYVQVEFGMDRIRALAPQHPQWQEKEPYKSALAGDFKGVLASGWNGFRDLMVAGHAGSTTEEFERQVEEWLKTTRHPRFKRPYTDLVYQPMLELLAFLRTKQFKTYVVSGGGIEFMRPWTQRAYGIPPEQVVGSTIKLKYEIRGDRPVLVRLPELDFVDDRAGKPVAIEKFIGRRPIMAFGNSDGDYEMLRWTTAGKGPRFGLIVHHTDADREYAYDRDSIVGRLVRALAEAPERGWTVVNMKHDWNVIFPFERKPGVP